MATIYLCHSNESRSVNSRKCLHDDCVFKRYHIDEHFSEFLPTRWRQKSTSTDMERNYVVVTLCIDAFQLHSAFRLRAKGLPT